MTNGEIAGLPKWAWIAAAGAVVLALLLSRRGSGAQVINRSDPSVTAAAIAADADARAQDVSARTAIAGALIGSTFSAVERNIEGRTATEIERTRVDATYRALVDNNRTQLAIQNSNNMTARYIARRQYSGWNQFWDSLGSVARDIGDILS